MNYSYEFNPIINGFDIDNLRTHNRFDINVTGNYKQIYVWAKNVIGIITGYDFSAFRNVRSSKQKEIGFLKKESESSSLENKVTSRIANRTTGSRGLYSLIHIDSIKEMTEFKEFSLGTQGSEKIKFNNSEFNYTFIRDGISEDVMDAVISRYMLIYETVPKIEEGINALKRTMLAPAQRMSNSSLPEVHSSVSAIEPVISVSKKIISVPKLIISTQEITRSDICSYISDNGFVWDKQSKRWHKIRNK